MKERKRTLFIPESLIWPGELYEVGLKYGVG